MSLKALTLVQFSQFLANAFKDYLLSMSQLHKCMKHAFSKEKDFQVESLHEAEYHSFCTSDYLKKKKKDVR